MITSKPELFEKATTKLKLAMTAAALWIATITFADRVVTSLQSTSAAPASYTVAQVQTIRECDPEIFDYLDNFEGMLSDLACRS